MKQRLDRIVMALMAVALVFAALAWWRSPSETGTGRWGEERLGGKAFSRSVRYTVYVGLNDKDAGEQLMPTGEARAFLNAIAARHVKAFTVYRAEGYWTNAAGEAASEETLVYEFIDATEAQVAALVAEMKGGLNQEAILVEKERTTLVFQ